MVRAKFKLNSVTNFEGTTKQLRFYAVSADEVPENQRYHKYTPGGMLEITIDNPPASDFFKIGQSYYLDFSEVVKPAT